MVFNEGNQSFLAVDISTTVHHDLGEAYSVSGSTDLGPYARNSWQILRFVAFVLSRCRRQHSDECFPCCCLVCRAPEDKTGSGDDRLHYGQPFIIATSPHLRDPQARPPTALLVFLVADGGCGAAVPAVADSEPVVLLAHHAPPGGGCNARARVRRRVEGRLSRQEDAF